MKAIKAPVVLLVSLVLVLTFSVISSAVTDKPSQTKKYVNGTHDFNGKHSPSNATAGDSKPTSSNNSSGNSIAPSITSQNSTSDNQTQTVTNATDAQLQVEIQNATKQTDTLIASDNKNMQQINIQKSQVDNYIDYIKASSIVYNDAQLAQLSTLLSTLTTDSQTVRSDTATLSSDINMISTFSNNKNYKNTLIKLNDEQAVLKTRSSHISIVGTDLTSTLSLLVQGQLVGSIINEPTASPSTSILVPSDNNTTN